MTSKRTEGSNGVSGSVGGWWNNSPGRGLRPGMGMHLGNNQRPAELNRSAQGRAEAMCLES